MNAIDIMILVILGISLINGMRKGFVGSILAVAGFAAALFGAIRFSSYMAGALQSNETVMGAVTYYIDAGSLLVQEYAGKLVAGLSNSDIGRIVSSVKLPDALVEPFRSSLASQTYLTDGIDTVSEYLGHTLGGTLINILSFALMFIISYIVILLIIKALDAVFRFPLLRHFDSLIGGVFGLLRGAVIAMLIFSVVPFVTTLLETDALDALIAESKLYIYFCRGGILETFARSIL